MLVYQRYASPRPMLRAAFLLFASLLVAPVQAVVPERVAVHPQSTVLVASAASEAWPYLAFPALLDRGDEILVSYKRARSHAQDPCAQPAGL